MVLYTNTGLLWFYIAFSFGSIIIQSMKSKNNFFPTLNAALESEGLLDTWEITFPPIGYGQTYSYTYQDGSRHGRFISVYRTEGGLYERPVHYAR